MPGPYDPAANPDFRAALVAYWLATPGLLDISPAPYADQAPIGRDPPYCALSEVSTTLRGRGTRARSYWENTIYQFSIYDHDQAVARELGEQMVALLDPIQDRELRFADGYQRSWFRVDARQMEVPEVVTAGARTIWKQDHLYAVSVGRRRAAWP